MKTKQKYTAIKIKGMSYWMWFETKNVNVKDGFINATGGHGKGGAYVDANFSENLVEGQIFSESLQYT